ncbi:MAG TPA: LLM class flavin-dependent oxidoreductase [Thermomicrobiaceae bacterium]|nr:LLM class flavin-dependent oxidoreductase [Thermomicrobiaceae bacterium]
MDRPSPLFGLNVHPGVEDPADAFRRARIADASAAIELVMIQDHPYLANFFDTWTLLTLLAGATERVHLGTNVSPLPLRPPAMLAKAAATLDVLSGGRAELGIGAGGFRQALEGFGGAMPDHAEIVDAFAEAIQVIRGLWRGERGFTFAGKHHHVHGAHFGPAPAHPIRLWIGANRPRMLRLTGQYADGVLVSNGYVGEDELAEVNRAIDRGAERAGRSPEEIRRGYNVMGMIDLPGLRQDTGQLRRGTPLLPATGWVDYLVRLYRERRMDTFIFWPLGEYQLEQLEVFAGAVAPAVAATVAGSAAP